MLGFGLRLRKAGGNATWFVNVPRRGKRVRLTLGRADATSAERARAAARAALAAVVLDGLPTPPKKPEAITFATFAVEFTKDYAHHWKPATRKTSADYLRRELLPVFSAHAVTEIMRTDISRWRDGFAGKREEVFKRTVPILSVMLKHAEQLGYRRRGSNPCRGIARYKRQLPERYLSPVECKRLGRMLDPFDTQYPTEVAAIRMLLFTGARRGEIETLEWRWVKPDRLALPDSMTGAKIVYLNAPARAVLAGVTRQPGTPLVFPDRQMRTLRLDNFWARFRRKCALPGVRLHDLRHNFASTAIKHGIPLATIGRLLGRARPGSTARYALLADDTIADAAQRVSGSLAASLGLDR